MADIACVLGGHLAIDFLCLIIALSFLHGPVEQVLHQYLQVGNTKVAGLDVVITQVFRLVGGVDGSNHLLSTKLIHGVASVFLNPCFKGRLLILGLLNIGKQLIAPVDGMNVIDTEVGRRELDATLQIARLCHVVITGIVHDTRSGTILLRKLRITQRIYRE